MPLRRKLFAQIAAALLLSVLVGAVMTYWQGRTRIDEEMTSALDVADVTLRDSVAQLAITPPTDPLTVLGPLIKAFDGDRHLRAVWVDAEGRDRTRSALREPAVRIPAWVISLFDEPARTRSVALKSDALLPLGRIELRTSAVNEISELWDDMRLRLTIVGGFSALALAFVYLTVGRALRPLEDLSAGLMRVADGDYSSQVPEHGPSEFKTIYRAFNQMAGKLDAAEKVNTRLTEQLTHVQEEERAEIARDLHDEIGPFLFAVDADAKIIEPMIERGKLEDVRERAAAIRQSVRHMQTHIKDILARLKPVTLVDLGLAAAIENLVSFWTKRAPGVSFTVTIPETPFGLDTDTLLFRIIQEATSNAMRHGRPSRVEISVEQTTAEHLTLRVRDDGVGMPRGPVRGDRRSFGLAGINERLATRGGTLTVGANTFGDGVILTAEIPLTAPARDATVANHDDDHLRGAA